MGAHDIVDIIRLDPDTGEIGEIRRAHSMKLRPRRALLVIAEAGIDQDRVTSGLDDKGMKAEDQLAAAWLDQLWPEQIGVGQPDFGVEIGKELRRGEER